MITRRALGNSQGGDFCEAVVHQRARSRQREFAFEHSQLIP